MVIIRSICDTIVSEYNLIANIPISQMYQHRKCIISCCYFYQVALLPINCVPKTVLSVSTRQEELHNIGSTEFSNKSRIVLVSMALTVHNELNLSKTFQIV